MKYLVGLSGGVDSACGAYLLREQGHEVIGAAVRMHEYTDLRGAEAVAEALGIPFVVLDARERFQRRVVEPFMDAYLRAETPNPCVFCNPAVKFGALCDYAAAQGLDRVSTGHYCRILRKNGRSYVRRAADAGKDQSYVLWGLTQEQLALLEMPLASLTKSAIRVLAERLRLPCAAAPESQEICFIPDHDYAAFIEARRGRLPEGNFIDAQGNVLGRHRGILHYTIGQRKGLGIALGRPMFVSAISAADNTVTLSDAGGEYRSSLTATGLVFQKMEPCASGTFRAAVKIRYAAAPAPCTVRISDGRAEALFDEPVRAVTPGQSAVFYDGEDILLGGLIDGIQQK